MDFIIAFIAKHGYSPSYDEMKDQMGLKSKSVIHYIVDSLVDSGLVRYKPNRARSVFPTRNYMKFRKIREIDSLVEKLGHDSALKLLRSQFIEDYHGS